MENFLDLTMMDQVIGVCVTHMDMVAWTPEEFLPMLKNELGLEANGVIFSGIHTSGNFLCEFFHYFQSLLSIQKFDYFQRIDEFFHYFRFLLHKTKNAFVFHNLAKLIQK